MNDERSPSLPPAAGEPSDASAAWDRVRAWAEGRLDPAGARALEAELATDPGLAADAATYRSVVRLTQPLADEVPRTSLVFDDLPLDEAPGGWRPRLEWVAVAAAALVLLAVGLLLREGRAPERPAPTVVVGLELLSPATPPDEPPATLLQDYRPVRDGAIAWTTSEADARALAAYAGRPVLLYARHPECPWCRALERGAFADAGVLAEVAAFVPLRLDVTSMPEADAMRLFEQGWPYVAVTDADGKRLAFFPGERNAASLRSELRKAAPTAAPLPWDAVATLARNAHAARSVSLALREALASAAAGRLVDAREGLAQAAAAHADTPAALEAERVLAAWPPGAPPPSLQTPDRVETPR